MNELLSELKSRCTAGDPQSVAELIRTGKTTWFGGRPAGAPEGTIALSQGGDIKLIINEGDVLDVEKHGELYLVNVSADSHVLVRIEKLVKADVRDCRCDGSDEPAQGVAQRSTVVGNQGGEPTIVVECEFKWICWWPGSNRYCFIYDIACKRVG